MSKWMLIILIIGIIYIFYKLWLSVPFELQVINFFSGGLGSGKTLEATTLAINLRNRSKLKYYLLNKYYFITISLLTIILSTISIKYIKIKWLKLACVSFIIIMFVIMIIKNKIIRNKYKIRTIYSNYPILINEKKKVKEWSKPLTREHWLGIKEMEENAIIIIDEVDRMFPSLAKKSDEELEKATQQIRHWLNPTVIMVSQSLGSVDIAIRRRINVVYNLSGHKKIFWKLYKEDINKIVYMEDIITNINDINEIKPKRHFGFYGKKRYESRYMKEFYRPEKTKEEEYEEWKKYTIDYKDKEKYMK